MISCHTCQPPIENISFYHLYHLHIIIVKDIIDSKNDNMMTTAVGIKKENEEEEKLNSFF